MIAGKRTIWGTVEASIVATLIAATPVVSLGAIAEETGSWVVFGVGMTLSVVMLVRAWTVSVTVSEKGIVARNLLRTYRVAWRDVVVVEAGRRPAGQIGGDVGVAVVKTRLPSRRPWGVDDPTWEQQIRLLPALPNTMARFTIDASLGLGPRRKARLVDALRSHAAQAGVGCTLTERDLDTDQYHWTSRQKLPKAWGKGREL
jgi:hypothetical protein